MKSIDDLKVIVISSESSYFKKGEELSFKEASELFEKAEKEIRKLKEEIEYGYDKVRALIETPEGEIFGFRYDIGDSYAENLIDFCSKRFPIATLNEYLKEEVTGLKAGDLILDKENSIKLITGISNETYECFKIKSEGSRKLTDIAMHEDIMSNEVVDLGTKYTLAKEDIKNFVGELKENEFKEVQQYKNLFEQKGMTKEFKPNSEFSNRLNNGMDFSMK